MSMVDGAMVIARCEDRGDHIMFFDEHDQEAFAVSPQSKLPDLIPFTWHYVWSNSEERYVYSSVSLI